MIINLWVISEEMEVHQPFHSTVSMFSHVHNGPSRRFRRISTETHSLMSKHSDPGWTHPAIVTAGKYSCGRSCRSGVWTCGGTWLTDSDGLGIVAPPVSKHPDLGCTRASTVLAVEGPNSRSLYTCWVFPAFSTIFKVGNALAFHVHNEHAWT